MRNQTIPAAVIAALCIATIAEAKYSDGSGEPNDPYRIATAEDLNDIGNYEEDWNKHFILVNDINLAEYTGTQFKIIGRWIDYDDPNNKPFTGVFDGNDHKIRNFTFTWTSKDICRAGLFGYLGEGGEIKNLGMENVDVNALSGWYVGSLAARCDAGAITNCYSTGSVTGMWDVGGLVGLNDGAITNSYSIANVSGTGDYVGGLVGHSFSRGPITDCYSTGSVSGHNYMGGLAGGNDGEMTRCYSTSSVSGDNYVGGLAGNNGRTMADCYTTGTVTGEDYTGGLVGSNERSGRITRCYSTGGVTGNYSVGGLVGYGGGPVTASFWDTQTSGQSTSVGGTPKTTAEMKIKSTFTSAGWDFVNVWDICERTNYPKFVWQIPPIADFVCPDGVDFVDFAILASAWQTELNDAGWNAACDISQPKDNIINELDLAIFASHWLEGPP